MIRKILYSVFVNATIIGVLAFAAFGFSQVYAWFNTGADRSQILLLESEKISSVYEPLVRWNANPRQEGRPLENATIEKIKTDYVAGYYYFNRASYNHQTEGLKDYFTEDFRKPLIKVVNAYEETGQQVRGTTIGHDITPQFYAADGTLMTLTDEVISYYEISLNGHTVSYYDTAKYDIMLLLEDNYWRIRHKVRSEIATERSVPSGNIEPYQIEGDTFMESGKAWRLKCMNYYPATSPWQVMWEEFDEATIDQDFAVLDSMGFNSVRIFVPFDLFGKNEVKEAMLMKLKKTLDLAQTYDLQVIVTLFDFFLGYQVDEWTISDRHAEQIISRLKDHPALFAWDLKNEPDLDFERIGEKEVTAWLDFMIKRIRTYDGENFITIGWSQPEVSDVLADEVDFVSFHFYRSPEELTGYLRNNLNSHKPLFAGETGMHSYDSWWFPFGKSEAEQADYVGEVLEILKHYRISYGIWTLHDFANVPSTVAGRAPWKKNPQKRYGLIDHKGNQKAIYQTVLNFNLEHK